VLGALAFLAGVMLLATDVLGRLLGGAAVTVLLVLAARDLLVRVRLAADQCGLRLVQGFTDRRQISWLEVERIRVAVGRRRGLRAELVEIDTGEHLFLLGSADLGADARSVVDALTELWAAHRRSG
jgi:hypothetical protein